MVSPGPVAFTLFGVDINWYGIIIAFGMLLAIFISYYRVESHGISKDGMLDVVIVAIPAAIVGARLYYVAFEWERYAGDFLKIINIRGGGLAIHGGLIAAFIVVFLMCRHKKISAINGLDMAVPSIALAQGIGRWGNFFNEEAHGIETDVPWAVIIDGVSYHPTFLYESIWCIGLFFVLSYIDKHRKFTGQVFALYLILYSLERFFVESLRTDSLMIGPFRQAMVLSACVIAVGIVLYVVCKRRGEAQEKINEA